MECLLTAVPQKTVLECSRTSKYCGDWICFSFEKRTALGKLKSYLVNVDA